MTSRPLRNPIARIVRLCVLALPIFVLAAPPQACAQVAAPMRSRDRDLQTFILGSPYADAGLVITSLTMGALGTFVLEPPSTARPPFNGGRSHDANSAAAHASDAIFGVAMAGSIGFAFLIEHREERRGVQILRAPLVIGESVLFTLGVVSMLKNTLGECRPRAWDEATSTCVGTEPGHLTNDDLRSWPSGHSAGTFAVVGATLGLWLLPSGHRPRFAGLFAASTALAITTMTLRMVAGAHDAVDTTSGAALGIGLGFATAAMHLVRPSAPRLSLAASAHSLSVGLRGRF